MKILNQDLYGVSGEKISARISIFIEFFQVSRLFSRFSTIYKKMPTMSTILLVKFFIRTFFSKFSVDFGGIGQLNFGINNKEIFKILNLDQVLEFFVQDFFMDLDSISLLPFCM